MADFYIGYRQWWLQVLPHCLHQLRNLCDIFGVGFDAYVGRCVFAIDVNADADLARIKNRIGGKKI